MYKIVWWSTSKKKINGKKVLFKTFLKLLLESNELNYNAQPRFRPGHGRKHKRQYGATTTDCPPSHTRTSGGCGACV